MRYKIYGLFFLTVLLCAFAIPSKAQQLVNLSPADFLAGINATPNAQIIDLRTPEDYMDKHNPGAVNMKDQMCFSDTLFIYCRVGKTNTVAQLLFDNGYSIVYSLKGGSVAWEEYEAKLQRQKRKSPTL